MLLLPSLGIAAGLVLTPPQPLPRLRLVVRLRQATVSAPVTSFTTPRNLFRGIVNVCASVRSESLILCVDNLNVFCIAIEIHFLNSNLVNENSVGTQ